MGIAPQISSIYSPLLFTGILGLNLLVMSLRFFHTGCFCEQLSGSSNVDDIAEYFKFIDYKKNLKIWMSAVAKQ